MLSRTSISTLLSRSLICGLFGLALVACSDDSSTSSSISDDAKSSSSVEKDDEGTGAKSSSSEKGDVAKSSSSSKKESGGEVSGEGANWKIETLSLEEEVARDADFVKESAKYSEFQDLPTIYSNVKDDEKVVFILRHARRTYETSKEGHLHAVGVEQALALGTALKSKEEFFYGYSEYTRARETAENISVGRGDAEFNSIEIPALNNNWFIKDSAVVHADGADANRVLSEWAYTGSTPEGFYDMTERSVELITQEVLPKIPADARVSVFISHDQLVGTLSIYCSNKLIDLKYYESRQKWINYLQGVAIIVDKSGKRRYVPVNGLLE